MSKSTIIIALVAVCAVCAAGIALNPFQSSEPATYSIEYQLNGGVNHPDNPIEYTSGTGATLYEPTREGMVFKGWFLDAGLTRGLDSIDKKTSGNLVLHAGWEKVKSTYTITYVLDGGVNHPDNPVSYLEGSTGTLYAPTKDGWDFMGWYLDAELTESCNTINPALEGDITLHARWGTSDVGTGFRMDITGTVSEGFGIVYNVSGSMTMKYLAYDWVSGRYFSNQASTLTYSLYGETVDTFSNDSSDWSGNSSVSWSYVGMDTISTVDGQKDCHVYRAHYLDTGAHEDQWVSTDGTLYKVEYVYSGLFSSQKITYTFVEDFTFTVDSELDVTAYAEKGLSITGEGTYAPGDTVTLTASGNGFLGWYDTSGNLLSTDASYSMTVAEDTVVYARNTDSSTLTFESDEPCTLPVTSGAVTEWILMDPQGNVIEGFNVSGTTHTFTDAGEFILLAKTSDGNVMWDVVVSGVIGVTFEWTYDGTVPMTYTMGIDYDDVVEYRNRYPVSDREQDVSGNHARDLTFATVNDPYIQELAQYFREVALDMELDHVGLAELVLDFSQGIEYQSDEIYIGYVEYWKFPLETLYDKGGDCEDTAILCATLLKALGYDSAMILLPGHMACGLVISDVQGNYITKDGRNYYYCETTSTNYDIGEMPSGYTTYDVILVLP